MFAISWHGRAAAGLALLFSTAISTGLALAKDDIGPRSTRCDGLDKNGSGWRSCLGAARAELSDSELFYAGYWLARSGSYTEALDYLKLVRVPDARTLTYIGFATRKLGNTDGALVHYYKALEFNPNYVVARAYMGEGFLAKGEPDKAKQQLAEIAQRCGISCVEFAELSGHIARYEKAASANG